MTLSVLRKTALLLVAAVLPMLGRAQSEIVVGATVPLTGTFAATGVQYYNSLRQAQDDVNAAGGINGKKLRILFEDTQGSNSTAVNALVKLIKEVNPPMIFLSSLSTQVLAMEPEIAKAKIPTLHGGGAMAIQERKNRYLFRMRPADNLQSGAMAYAITEVLKKTKPGILYAQDDYGLGAANALEAILAKTGSPVVAKEAFNPRDNDFSAQLLALKNKGVDVLVTINYVRDGALILKQRRSLGIDLPVVAGSGMAAPSTLDLVDADDLKGVYSTADTVLGESISPASAEFAKKVEANYKLRPDPFGAAYYDAVMLAAEGLRKVGPDPEKLRAYFAAVNGYKGVARSYAIEAETNNLAHSVVLVSFKPGSKALSAIATYPKP